MDIIIALAVGFIGGVVGALVVVEARLEDTQNKIDSLIDGHLSIKDSIKIELEKLELLDKAVRLINSQVTKDRTVIWQSLNDLWNEYDKQKKTEKEQTKTDEKPAEKPKRTTKKKAAQEAKDE